MKGALRLLLELWQSEQQAAKNLSPDGVIADLEQPLNPRPALLAADARAFANNSLFFWVYKKPCLEQLRTKHHKT